MKTLFLLGLFSSSIFANTVLLQVNYGKTGEYQVNNFQDAGCFARYADGKSKTLNCSRLEAAAQLPILIEKIKEEDGNLKLVQCIQDVDRRAGVPEMVTTRWTCIFSGAQK